MVDGLLQRWSIFSTKGISGSVSLVCRMLTYSALFIHLLFYPTPHPPLSLPTNISFLYPSRLMRRVFSCGLMWMLRDRLMCIKYVWCSLSMRNSSCRSMMYSRFNTVALTIDDGKKKAGIYRPLIHRSRRLHFYHKYLSSIFDNVLGIEETRLWHSGLWTTVRVNRTL